MSESRNRRRRQEPWTAVDVRCPFYLRDDKRTIECEGFGEGMIVTLSCSPEKKNKHMGTHCVGPFTRCPVYQNTMIKYTD